MHARLLKIYDFELCEHLLQGWVDNFMFDSVLLNRQHLEQDLDHWEQSGNRLLDELAGRRFSLHIERSIPVHWLAPTLDRRLNRIADNADELFLNCIHVRFQLLVKIAHFVFKHSLHVWPLSHFEKSFLHVIYYHFFQKHDDIHAKSQVSDCKFIDDFNCATIKHLLL